MRWRSIHDSFFGNPRTAGLFAPSAESTEKRCDNDCEGNSKQRRPLRLHCGKGHFGQRCPLCQLFVGSDEPASCCPGYSILIHLLQSSSSFEGSICNRNLTIRNVPRYCERGCRRQ